MRKISRAAVIAAIISLLLTGCSNRPTMPVQQLSAQTPTTVTEIAPTPDLGQIEEFLGNMTLAEKVGQLFFVRADVLDPAAGGVTAMSETIGNMLVRCPVGGVVFFEDNVESPEQLAALTQALQRASKTPLIFAVDEEGGAVTRLASTPSFTLPRFPSASAVGSQGPAAAEQMGKTIGAYLLEYGITMDFAPVADVNTNPANPVIGTRAFSSDAARAAELSGAMAAGLRSAGVIPVYKHFPGHGDTAGDSHLGPVMSFKSISELRACEWLPFIQNNLAGSAVMVGHIALPAVTGDGVPASLSEPVVNGILRGEMGFDGLVITDALAMRSVTASYTSGQAAISALRAGCDVLLMPESLLEAYRAVLEAVQTGELQETRIDESVRRILTYKSAAGLI